MVEVDDFTSAESPVNNSASGLMDFGSFLIRTTMWVVLVMASLVAGVAIYTNIADAIGVSEQADELADTAGDLI